MAKSVRASLLGHEYQHRQFWIEACQVFIGNPPVRQVGLECGPLRAFDDVVTDYATPIPDNFLSDIDGDHYQCKFHVAYDREITGLDLAKPAFIDSKTVSLLGRLADATRGGPVPRRMTLVSPHRIDKSDELRKLVGPRSGGEINADPLFDPHATKAMIAIRDAWMKATGAADEAALRSIISHLRIRDGVSMEDLEDKLDYRLALAGLEPVDRTSAIHRYDALAKGFISARQYQHDRAVLEAHLRREKLYRGLPAPDPDRPEQLGIKSFAPFAYDLEDETSVLNLLRFFHGREKLADVGWDTDILPELVGLVTSKVRSGRSYDLHLDTHLSVSFAAGEVLGKAPATIVPVQRFQSGGRARWDTTGTEVTGPVLEEPRIIDLGGGAETAFAVEVTRLVADDVAIYVKRELPQVGRIVVVTIAGGPSQQSVRDGAHAHALAESIAARVLAERGAKARALPMHLFASAPGGLTFLLGRLALPWGSTISYEFDFGGAPGSYAPAFHLPPSAPIAPKGDPA